MENQAYPLIAGIIGLALGILIAWLLLRGRIAMAAEQGRAEVSIELASFKERASRIPSLETELAKAEQQLGEIGKQDADLREESGRVKAELAAEQEKCDALAVDLQNEKSKRSGAEGKANELETNLAKLTTTLEEERKQAGEKLQLLEKAKEELSNQFKSLASDILEEKSKRFTEQNQTNITQLLNPLNEKMKDFKDKVEEIHLQDTAQQASLKTELENLKSLNLQMTAEAHSLATALKGQAKVQGNWGEMMLENVLSRSGLEENKDYKREVSFNTGDGSRQRPDAIIYLPQNKHLIIDAKVSLNAYTRYVSVTTDVERQHWLKEHVKAISDRIDELSDRNYFDLGDLNSPEMVFMFIPVESAFVEALRADSEIFQKAIQKNVLVATPTTLLTSLNIVRQLWRYEAQNKNTADIAKRAAGIYDKLVNFVESMENVGHQLDNAKNSYNKAFGQLSTGSGNLIKQAMELKKMGVSPKKSLPPNLSDKAELELETDHEHIQLIVDKSKDSAGENA